MNDLAFKAPWGRSLRAMTALSIFVLAGVPLIGISTGPRDSMSWDFYFRQRKQITLMVGTGIFWP